MSYRKAEALLATVIIARATSLLIVKASLGGFSTFNLMALRFGIAFFCLLPFVGGRLLEIRRDTLLRGGALGAVFFVIIAIELQGLRMTDSSAVVAFLENTAIVLVPLAEAALRRRLPCRKNLLCAALALLGVGFLLLRGGRIELTAGVIVCMGTALLYTAYIILTDRLSHQDDPLLLGFLAIGVVYLVSGIVEYLIYVPMLGAGGSYLAFITGNLINMKIPCAINARDIVGVKSGTPENEIVATLSIATSSLVTILVLAAGVLLMIPLQPILQSPVLEPAFSNVVPALFGAMAYKYYRMNLPVALIVLAAMMLLFVFVPSLIGSTSMMIIPSGALAIVLAFLRFQKNREAAK